MYLCKSHLENSVDALAYTVADLRGGVRDARPPLCVQILSISCSFWENLAKLRVHAPPLEGSRPPLGEILDPSLVYMCKLPLIILNIVNIICPKGTLLFNGIPEFKDPVFYPCLSSTSSILVSYTRSCRLKHLFKCKNT